MVEAHRGGMDETGVDRTIMNLFDRKFSSPSMVTSVLRVSVVFLLTLPLIGCPLLNSRGSESSTQSILQRALFLEQRNDVDLVGQIQPTSRAHFQFLLGELALSEERPEEALEHFESAIEDERNAAPTLRLRLARLYLQQKQLDEALEQLLIVSEAEPENVLALQLKAGVLATLGKEDEAIEAYRKLIELKGSTSEEPYIFAASLHLQASQFDKAKTLLEELLVVHPRSFFGNYYLARIAEAQSKFQEAEKYYKRALELSPRADSVRIELARLYGSQKRFEKGIAVIEEILQKDANNVEAKTLKGQLLIGEKQFDKAINEFEEVSKLEEDSSKIRFRIGLVKLQRRNVRGAITDFNLVLAKKPDNTAARYYLASAYSSLGQISEAIGQIKQISSEQKYFIESRTLGAFILQREKRHEEAIELLEEVIETNEDVAILGFLANLHKEAGDLPNAIKYVKRIIELEPDVDRHYFTLGVYSDQAGDWPQTVSAMNKALELNPGSANTLNYLGYAYAERGEQLVKAQGLIRQAIEIEPGNGYYIDSLGWVLFQKGEYKKALAQLEKAAELVPNDAVILEHLARGYKAVGKLDLARTVAEKALEYAPESEDTATMSRLRKFLTTLP